MSSLIAREESLLKQLVRSRATKRDDLLLPGFGLPVRNARSFSQPPPRMKAAVAQPGVVTPPSGCKSPGSPNTPHPVQYTLQWLPYTLVYQPSQHTGLNNISLSQPDLSRCGTSKIPDHYWSGVRSLCNSPQGSTRCSSLSPMRCPSPVPPVLSPFHGSLCGSRPPTPAGSRGCSPSRSRPITPTILLNSQEICVNNKIGYYVNSPTGVGGAGSLQTIEETARGQHGTNDIQWKVALEAERFQTRKYSLTENIAYMAESGAFNRDPNNNPGNTCYYDTPPGYVTTTQGNGYFDRSPHPRGNWVSSTSCCCYSDLCCKVCLVLDKDTPSLTLDEMQARAFNNILMQKSPSNDKCHCSSCEKMTATATGNGPSSVQTTMKKVAKNNEVAKKRPQTLSSASGSNQGAIDNRIEQAMDLVKSHLMNAVRSEVDELKERIVKLEDIIAQLQTENEFFRANVHRDVLLQLQQQQQQQQQQQSLGYPSQLALQMIQQPPNSQLPPQI